MKNVTKKTISAVLALCLTGGLLSTNEFNPVSDSNIISAETFSNDDFSYTVSDKTGITITKFINETKADVTVPDEIGGVPVTVIDSEALAKSQVINVTLGINITSINSYAFSGCTSLTEINIPDSVTDIGDYAFRDCSSLKSFTSGANLVSIGNFAFINARLLETVVFYDSLKKSETVLLAAVSALLLLISRTLLLQ